MIDNKSYIHIGGWMINELKLKGNELYVYAVIYSFTNGTEDHYFNGSLSYLSEWTNQSIRNVQNNLKSLLDKGLITKDERYENGVKFVRYKTTYGKNFQGLEKISENYGKNFQGGMEKSSNNIQYNIYNYIQDEEKEEEKEINNEGSIKYITEYEDIKEVIEDYEWRQFNGIMLKCLMKLVDYGYKLEKNPDAIREFIKWLREKADIYGYKNPDGSIAQNTLLQKFDLRNEYHKAKGDKVENYRNSVLQFIRPKT